MNENKKISVKRPYRLTHTTRTVTVREIPAKVNEPFKRFDVTIRRTATYQIF